jgi:hypothetical protein
MKYYQIKKKEESTINTEKKDWKNLILQEMVWIFLGISLKKFSTFFGGGGGGQ